MLGNAFVVKGGETSLALTSYEAVAGASIIRALVPGEGLITVHLAKYAPETNLALLEIPVPNLPAVKIGNFEVVHPRTALDLVCSNPIMDGADVTASTTEMRNGVLQSTITRPSGAILRVSFSPGIEDMTTGAPIILPTTGEVIAVSLSLELSQINTLRFAVPAQYVTALCPEMADASGVPSYVKVKDGSEAPVKKDDTATDNPNGYSTASYAIVIAIAIAIVGFVAYKTRSRKEKVVPFSNLPTLPEDVPMAFVTADGKVLPTEADIIKIGRAPDNVWVFPEATVSNYHARIRKTKNSSTPYEVEDLRSSNGTFVGKRRIVSAESITPGTIIRFGKKIEVMLMLRTQAADPMAQLGLKKVGR